jgi:polar amino acid transport system substrate-binding protein
LIRPRLVLVAAICAACGGGAPGSGTLAKIKEKGELTWGADLQGGEPYLYEDPADHTHIIGFEAEIMEAIARRLGVRAKMAQYNWSNLVPSLERGDFDIILNGLEATKERQDRILLSVPYFTYAETLVVRRDSKFRYIFDLVGKRVATLNQTYAQDILDLFKGSITPVLYEGNDEPYDDLQNQRVDGVLLDNIIAERYGCVPKHPDIVCLPTDVERGVYVAGIRKTDRDLKEAIDGAITAMRADGELERILRKANLWDERQKGEAPGASVAGATARTFDWEMFVEFAEAAWLTLQITVLSFLLAVPVGLLLAIMRVYGGPISRTGARVYIELFRGTPVLLQLMVLYYGMVSYVNLSPMLAAVLGLGLNYGAYEAEVYRGALLAVPRGQIEASKALGMGGSQTLRHVLLPQAFRVALPPMTNDFVSLLKDSSLVGVITVIELTKRMSIAGVELRGYLVAGIACAAFYLVLSLPLSELARRLERRLARDQRPQAL